MKADTEPEQWNPHNLDAEQGLLGHILVNNEAIALLDLEPDHFYEPIHARIFHAAKEMATAGKKANPITLRTYFEHDATLTEIGGARYLARLAAQSCAASSLAQYAETIRDMAQRREAINQLDSARNELLTPAIEDSADLIVTRLSTALTQHSRGQSQAVHISDAVETTLNAASEIYKNQQDVARINIGMRKLEKLVGGLRRGNYVLVGGRPGMGKTAVGIAVALSAAALGVKTLFLSLEMSKAEIGARVVSATIYQDRREIPYTRVRGVDLTGPELDRLYDGKQGLTGTSLWLEARDDMNSAQIAAAVAYAKLQHGLDLVILDYLGLVRPSERYAGRKVEEIAEVSAALKRIALHNDVLVLAMHQLSREIEKRDTKRPFLADLRDSGSLEQDADMVWFPFREAYYLKHDIHSGTGDQLFAKQAKLREVEHVIEIIVAKNRHGETGSVKMFCDIGSNYIADHRPGDTREELPL
jgi:replicative DNA helicase